MRAFQRLSLVLPLLVAPLAYSQGPKAVYVVGEVKAIEAGSHKVTLQTDAGASISAALAPNAPVVRAKPGSTNLADASPIAFEDLAVGDRIMVHGYPGPDGSTMDVRKVVVMTKGDIAQKQDAERAEWRKRGLVAVVTSVDAQKGEISARTGRRPDAPAVVIDVLSKKAGFKRYAPNSVRFADAKPGSIADIQPGDELRALGDRSGDGARLAAEQVVSGSFRVIAGGVTTVSPDKKEVVLKDDDSQKPVTVSVGPDARMRHLPPEMALRFGPRRAEGPSPSPAEGDGRARRGVNPEDLIERMPTITLADLKPGDRILVSSTKGDDPAHMTAIVLVSGLEAIPAPAGPRRPGRGTDVGLPADLMDLGLSLQ
jgi:hypothetical protein